MGKILLAVLAILIIASGSALAGKKKELVDRDGIGDRYHVSFEESREIIERAGYRDIVLVDKNRRDNFNEFDATAPDGQRVRVRSKNTTGDIVFVDPVWY